MHNDLQALLSGDTSLRQVWSKPPYRCLHRRAIPLLAAHAAKRTIWKVTKDAFLPGSPKKNRQMLIKAQKPSPQPSVCPRSTPVFPGLISVSTSEGSQPTNPFRQTNQRASRTDPTRESTRVNFGRYPLSGTLRPLLKSFKKMLQAVIQRKQ